LTNQQHPFWEGGSIIIIPMISAFYFPLVQRFNKKSFLEAILISDMLVLNVPCFAFHKLAKEVIYLYLQKKVYSFKLSEETAGMLLISQLVHHICAHCHANANRPVTSFTAVTCVKFIARKEWFAAGSSHKGFSIHVYSYETKLQKITHIEGTFMCLSLAVHPTEPYLLSRDTLSTRLWNWDKNCTHTFQENNCTVEVCQDAFSSEGTIASASNECTIKV
jgi:WD40 repeat protein